ncbi:MAG: endonuclease/exonuclease/phosphatase family protein [Flavobacteriaceae bacterium]
MEVIKPKNNIFTIAFYNLENLFDTIDDPGTLDDDFTPDGKKKWTPRRYKKKIKRLARAISSIGDDFAHRAPVILGIAEVENFDVVTDLIQNKYLVNANYGIVHYDSPDERGIEVAFLYRKKYFEFLESTPYPLHFMDDKGNKDHTRDVLLVKGNLNGELMYFIVNHWSSRRSGTEFSEHKRIKAAHLVQKVIADIAKETENPKIIIMGDFNDNPTNKSIKEVLVTDAFYNPMESLHDKGMGTSTHQGDWYLFDQIIFSKNFLKENKHTFKHANIYCKHFLKDKFGKYIEDPFRTYRGRWYKGGISDHFPVYISLKFNPDK